MKKIFLLLLILLLNGCLNTRTINDDNNQRVFYEIFVSSFSDSNNDGIGDLKGIINRLDYLNDNKKDSVSSLGIEGIWLTPVFKSDSYHKYDTIDYYKIDESFGDESDLKELINECHKRNIKLILDLAINHTSDKHEWFKKFIKAHQIMDFNDPYYNYYSYVDKNSIPSDRKFYQIGNTDHYYEANFVKEMPELNFESEDVRNEVLNIARYYLSLGIDGFRFDAAKYLYLNDDQKTLSFFDWYEKELKKINKDVYLVMEVWSDDDQMNRYNDVINCFDFSVADRNGLITQSVNGLNLYFYTDYLENYQKQFTDDNFPVFFISNHDMDRASEYISVSSGKAYLAANLSILTPGSPFIYYGEEIGMKGLRGDSNSDANRRLAMLWGDDDTVKDPSEADYPSLKQINKTLKQQLNDKDSLLRHYIKLISIRKKYPEIAKGTYTKIETGNKDIGGFKISLNESTIYLFHNNSSNTVTINTDAYEKVLDYAGYKNASYKKGELLIGPYTSVILK